MSNAAFNTHVLHVFQLIRKKVFVMKMMQDVVKLGKLMFSLKSPTD